MRFQPRRSSPRLAGFAYRGSYAYHLILATQDRLPQFRHSELVTSCLQSLAASADKYDFEILAYCFMPDHLHLLVAGDDRALLVRFVQHFKQATGFRHPALWQRSFYDRILRYEEVLEDIACYIWVNPVRAKLAANIAEYPFSGPRKNMPRSEDEDRAEALSLREPDRNPVGEGRQEVPAWKP